MREAMAQFDAQALERKVKQKNKDGNSADTVPTPNDALAGPSQATIWFKLNPVMASLAHEIISTWTLIILTVMMTIIIPM